MAWEQNIFIANNWQLSLYFLRERGVWGWPVKQFEQQEFRTAHLPILNEHQKDRVWKKNIKEEQDQTNIFLKIFKQQYIEANKEINESLNPAF